MSYQPLKITGNSTGLVQDREEFLLPDDAYPVLENAWLFRERILRKQGFRFLGRLQRNFTSVSIGNSPASSTWTIANFYSLPSPSIPESNPELVLGSVIIVVGSDTFTDQGNGTLKRQDGNVSSTINYITGAIVLNRSNSSAVAATATFSYYPNLPVMGIRTREKQNSAFDQTIFFDTTYAYDFNTGINAFEEFMSTGTSTAPVAVWDGNDYDFFWSTNYFIDTVGTKIFWAVNYSTLTGNPIRYTNGPTSGVWVDFSPQIDDEMPNPNLLLSARVLLPFRGRLVAFNTEEGPGPQGTGIRYTNRIRWAAIGTPFTEVGAITVPINETAWRDDIRGQGGLLNIPTSEDIVAVGFVRDNLVIYCENSTWQLRYTGRSIAPFQIEKVNSELGALSTFAAIQFDTSLVGIGDKGVVECDSYKSQLIDVKIPDFVYKLSGNQTSNSQMRIQSIRDFEQRICYWTVCSDQAPQLRYPDQRLLYNYDNDSWAIFTDNITALGSFQPNGSPRWVDIPQPWVDWPYPWISNLSSGTIQPVGGNQQGFVFYLDALNTNDMSLYIQAIMGNTNSPTTITSPSHNLRTGQIISISGIPPGTPFANLNGLVFMVVVINTNSFSLYLYNIETEQFSTPQLDPGQTYIGGGLIAVRDNFNITSKKFNFLDEGENIQLGYLDILMASTPSSNPGAISLNVYLDYNDSQASNTYPQNVTELTDQPDLFFNTTIPTTQSTLNTKGGTKFWQRVYCATRSNFLTLQYTFSNAQMAGIEQTLPVQIDAQVIWIRKAGKMVQTS